VGPFILNPAGKDYLWGGSRLKEEFGKKFDLTPLAETWECSTHPDGPSIVRTGEYCGKTLPEVLSLHPEFLGEEHAKGIDGLLPILIKLIDARDNLSVQVHPDDEYAFKYENGQLGKSEMWYVMDAEPGSELIFGLSSSKITTQQLRESIANGTFEKYLHRIPIHKNDVFFIKAGTIHAIGKGALIAEIQQSSNLTYRMYDYNRRGKDGKLRQLHVDKALEVSNLTGTQAPRQPMRVLKYAPGFASELLCRCKYFQVERMIVNSEKMEIAPLPESFRSLLCLSGEGAIIEGDERLKFCKGDSIFIPATSKATTLSGKFEILITRC